MLDEEFIFLGLTKALMYDIKFKNLRINQDQVGSHLCDRYLLLLQELKKRGVAEVQRSATTAGETETG